MDLTRDLFKSRKVVMSRQPELTKQYLTLKRVQQFVRDELVFQWVKTDGDDHMHFSLAYLLLAIKLRSRTQGWVTPSGVPLVSRYKLNVAV